MPQRPMHGCCSLVVVVAVAACGSSSGAGSASTGPVAFAAQPLMTVTSNSGNLRMVVRTAPQQPPSRGLQEVELAVTDASTGAPETGLVLDVLPWMPAMGHGASIVTSVREDSPGIYVVTDVDLFMAGTWELRTNVSGAVTDYAAPSFEIP